MAHLDKNPTLRDLQEYLVAQPSGGPIQLPPIGCTNERMPLFSFAGLIYQNKAFA